MALIEIENLTFAYSGCAPVLDGVTLSVGRGEFVVLAGRSGSGKTTLLNCIKPETVPYGTLSGRVAYDGRVSASLGRRESVAIGYVTQRALPVAADVIDDFKFGAENLGWPEAEIAAALAETAAELNIGGLLGRPMSALSGGEKKLVQLAGVLAMRPETLLLDEPTAQLDPAAAARFLDTLRRLNENGLTVVMTAHRGEALSFADRLAMLDGGKIVYCGRPCDAPDGVLPAPARLFRAIGGTGPAPLTVRQFLARSPLPAPAAGTDAQTADKAAPDGKETPAAELKNAYFAFDRHGPDVLRGATAAFYPGRHYCLLGALGSGKTTVLGAIGGVRIPYAGKVRVFGRDVKAYRNGALYGVVSAVSQEPRFMFTGTTVKEDLDAMRGDTAAVAAAMGITALLSRHPYDLSGGELQLAAMAKAMLSRPRLLLLDEPSKGLDRDSAARVGAAVRALVRDGITVITATHDVDFAAEYGDCAAFVFDGRITPPLPVDRFFLGNRWFTTDAARIARALGYAFTSVTRLSRAMRP